jgi:signal peptidase I
MLRLFLGASAILGWVFDASLVVRRARRGPWRAEVAEGSMAPALLPGDWLLLDPTGGHWPRPGSIVVIREPGSGILAIKRVAARGKSPGLEPRESWLLGDAPAGSIDSRAYGPLDADALVARAWFRYGPPGRIGRLR